MTSVKDIRRRSLFDFAPFAGTYDRWYATPDGRKNDLVQKADVFGFLARGGTGARLLDVGCGTGHWSRYFVMLGYAVVAVDVSLEMVRRALDSPENDVTFLMADAIALPFEDGAFDVAAAMATLEFLGNPQQALREMTRCVRKGGRILIGTLNRSASLNRQRVAEGREPYISGRLYSPDELRELLSPLGHVRMTASDPDDVFHRQERGRFYRLSSRVNPDGPFIVAEVRR